MAFQIGILIFDGAEELDFVGPWEVFTTASMVLQSTGQEQEVCLISEGGQAITCAKGMRIESDYSIGTCPPLDVLLVPGGQGTRREIQNPIILEWVEAVSRDCQWVTSVCTGSMVLTAAGPAKGKKVTTHWACVDELKRIGGVGEILEGVRYVRDGNVVTAAGVSAGIDMALWLLGQIYSPELARSTQKYIEYDPAPPYTAHTW